MSSELQNKPTTVLDYASPTRRISWRELLERFGPALALVLLVVYAGARESTFLKPENIFNILRQNSFVGILAVGMTFVIILGGIDLSVGSLVALVGGLGIVTLNAVISAGYGEGGAVVAAVAVMLVAGTAAGLLNGTLIAKGKLAPFIATLGAMAAFRSIALAMAGSGEFRSASKQVFPAIGTGGVPTPFEYTTIGYPVIGFALVALVGHVLLRHTRYGRYVYAIGCNERSAVYSAINVDRVKILTYTLLGVCGGISAMFLASRMNSVASGNTGNLYELDAIAAVVIGGTRMSGGSGTIVGTVIGVLILAVIGNMLNIQNVPSELHGLVKGLIIIAAVLVQRGRASA